jgi:LCP family protein required for cell wall assembly
MPGPNPKHRGGAARTGSARQRGRHASSYGDGFGRFASITTLSLVPGAGLIATGWRKLGFLLLLLSGLVVAALGVVALSGGVVNKVLSVAVSPSRLMVLAALAVLVGVCWAVTILVTAWRARPERPSPLQTVVGLVLVMALCALVVAPSAKGAQLAMVQRNLVTSVFTDQPTTPAVAGAARPKSAASDPWKGIPRVNMLLIGSDAGADRTGIRTDSMMVASIDTRTGNTLLVGLPRNLQRVPFPESNPLHQLWPNGYNCGDICLLNAVWTEAVQHKNLFPGNSNPGLTSTRDVISEITGLRIDTYTIIDLRGFEGLVQAMGGVTVNVPRKIPIGGGHDQRTGAELPINGYIQPGRQHLNGYQALWFSRSRSGSDDYDRMRRQRCMVGNLVNQVNPVQLLSKYGDLATVLKKNISTDIRQDQLQAWVVLVERMKKGTITSLPLTDQVINTVHPNYPAIKQYIQNSLAAISSHAGAPASTPSATATSQASSSGTSSTKSSSHATTPPKDSGTAQNLNAVC